MTNLLRVAQIVLDVIAIVLLVCAVGYVWLNKDLAKAMISDPCRVCEEKTGGVCATNIQGTSSGAAHQPINLSNIDRFVANESLH